MYDDPMIDPITIEIAVPRYDTDGHDTGEVCLCHVSLKESWPYLWGEDADGYGGEPRTDVEVVRSFILPIDKLMLLPHESPRWIIEEAEHRARIQFYQQKEASC